MKKISKYGFTLIELLVVVVIIAVLAAVAVPQYKRAVLKSRFSTVMPMAKSIADAQELYYLDRGYYAQENEKNKLDITPVEGGNTSVTLSKTDGYDYVMAQNSKVPGAHYIIYHKHSENYPENIHCEAEKDNADAEWLCSSLSNNNKIGVTLTRGYNTYLISGNGLGFSPWANAPTCDKAEEMGYTCNITTNAAGEQVKKICATVGTYNYCRTKTYDEDGGYTSVTCDADSSGVCTSYRKRFATYDAAGNMLQSWQCNSFDSNGNCTSYSDIFSYTYDANGNILSERQCGVSGSTLDCTVYSYGHDYTYDGNIQTDWKCSSIDSNGECTAYSSSSPYTYNANNKTRRDGASCAIFDSEGNCTASSTYGGHYYTYDADGNKLTERWCDGYHNSITGECRSYNRYGGHYDYTYDANGNMLTKRECNSGSCTSYASVTVFTYDDDGKLIYFGGCSGSNITSTGDCKTISPSSPANTVPGVYGNY